LRLLYFCRTPCFHWLPWSCKLCTSA
jgi:hypothetical protein